LKIVILILFLIILNLTIFFNTLIHNNEKYLFFECKKSYIDKFKKLIDFNLIISNKHFNNTNELIQFVENNMNGNNIIDNDNVIFNIIKTYYINDIGYILSGYLKQGKI
jgi:hypothetical protein